MMKVSIGTRLLRMTPMDLRFEASLLREVGEVMESRRGRRELIAMAWALERAALRVEHALETAQIPQVERPDDRGS